MTALETESLEVLRMVVDQISAGRPISRMDYAEFLGKIRDTVKRLECKQAGCAEGLHLSPCQCEEGKPSTVARR